MRWEDERYCRLFTRDSTNWILGPWQARAVLPLVMRKLDRAGLLQLNEDGMEGVAAQIQLPLEVVADGMAWWLKRGTLVIRPSVEGGHELCMPNYKKAQEAIASNKRRADEHRERARLGLVTQRDESSHDVSEPGVTLRDGSTTPRSPEVTHRNGSSREPASAFGSVTPTARIGTAQLGSAQLVRPGESAPADDTVPVVDDVDDGKRRRGHRLPEDWHPTAKTVAKFAAKGIDALGSLTRFKNHWLDSTTKGAVKLAWDRAFENWVDTDIEKGIAKKMPDKGFVPPKPSPDLIPCPPENARVLMSLKKKSIDDLFSTETTEGDKP